MRQNQVSKHGPVKADRCAIDVALKISLKTTVGEAGTGQFVFAKEQKQDGRGYACACDGLGRSR
jgi:hypothetical protein